MDKTRDMKQQRKKEETRVCKFEELALKREVRVCGRKKENGPDAGNGRSLS